MGEAEMRELDTLPRGHDLQVGSYPLAFVWVSHGNPRDMNHQAVNQLIRQRCLISVVRSIQHFSGLLIVFSD